MSFSLLLVEDDMTSRITLRKVLEHAGYLVQTAADGQSAISILQSGTYDAIVSDMRLPDLDGIAILRHAMAQPFPPAVLFLTGYGTIETAIAALRSGAYDYILKPCAPETLLQGIKTALQRRQQELHQIKILRNLARNFAQIEQQLDAIGMSGGQREPATPTRPATTIARDTLTIGKLRLGRFPHETRYHDQPFHLTPIEHAILRCLAEANGSVVTYTEILQRTHGYKVSSMEAHALLRSHIRNIRQKLNAELVVNVRAKGYRLHLPQDNAYMPSLS